jgi:probable HAF family extracellular repeat protein
MTALASLGGGFDQAYGINDRGWVVGQARNASGEPRAVLWAGGKVHDLNDLVRGAEGAVLDFAWGLNDRGWIVGNATDAAGQQLGFVLSPVPAPGALGLFGLALAGGLLLRRARPIPG